MSPSLSYRKQHVLLEGRGGKSISTPRLSAAGTIQVRLQNNGCALGQALLIGGLKAPPKPLSA